MSSSTVNLLFLVATLVSSVLFGTWLDPAPSFTKKDLLRGIESVVTKHREQISSGTKKKLLVGFNTNLDAIVPDGPGLLRMVPGLSEYADAGDVKVINSAQDFAKVFSHHFSSASAGERAIGNGTLWNEILEALERSGNDDIRIGGNAALMAESVAKGFPEIEVTLFGMAGSRIIGRLASRIEVVSGTEGKINVASESYPIFHDEVHLILEYPGGAKFGNHKAQRANRFIVSRDFSNGAIASLETVTYSHARNADALIIAGVHIMDGMISAAARSARLADLKKLLNYLPAIRLHFEMGSTGDNDFTKEMVLAISVDSIGLNEQEFFALCSSLNLCAADDKVAMTGAVPPVVKVQAAMTKLFGAFERLSRIHFHSYAYHIIAQRTLATSKWPNPRAAVAAGSLIATTRACASRVADLHGNKLTLSISSIKVRGENDPETKTIDLTPSDPVATFSFGGIDFYLAPVVACSVPKQTVGLGDYISSHALATQL